MGFLDPHAASTVSSRACAWSPKHKRVAGGSKGKGLVSLTSGARSRPRDAIARTIEPGRSLAWQRISRHRVRPTRGTSPKHARAGKRAEGECDRRRRTVTCQIRATVKSVAALPDAHPSDERSRRGRLCRAGVLPAPPGAGATLHPRQRLRTVPAASWPNSKAAVPVVTTGSCAANSRRASSLSVSTTASPYESSSVRTGPNTTMSPRSR